MTARPRRSLTRLAVGLKSPDTNVYDPHDVSNRSIGAIWNGVVAIMQARIAISKSRLLREQARQLIDESQDRRRPALAQTSDRSSGCAWRRGRLAATGEAPATRLCDHARGAAVGRGAVPDPG